MQMITINCGVEFLYDSGRMIGAEIDVSSVPEIATVVFDCLLEGKLKGILLKGRDKKHSVILCNGNNAICEGNPMEIHLSRSDCEIIRNLLLNVFIGDCFPGYHFDVCLNLNGQETEVCFLLKQL